MRIEVAGIPAPQGSKRHVGGGRMVEVSRAVGPWREAVRAETQRAMNGAVPELGPVSVEISFRLQRPKTVKAEYPAKRPDVDKLARAVLDGLVDGGAFEDDGQVVSLYAVKMYADRISGPPGCSITVDYEEDP